MYSVTLQERAVGGQSDYDAKPCLNTSSSGVNPTSQILPVLIDPQRQAQQEVLAGRTDASFRPGRETATIWL
jgi:hypothetical protein